MVNRRGTMSSKYYSTKTPKCIVLENKTRVCYCGKCLVEGYPLPADYENLSKIKICPNGFHTNKESECTRGTKD